MLLGTVFVAIVVLLSPTKADASIFFGSYVEQISSTTWQLHIQFPNPTLGHTRAWTEIRKEPISEWNTGSPATRCSFGQNVGGNSTATSTVETLSVLNQNESGFGDCSASGTYYWFMIDNVTGVLYYTTYTYNNVTGTFNSSYDPATSTPTTKIVKNIEIINPSYGTTTATTTFPVSVKYKTPFSLDFRPATIRHFEIVDALTGSVDYQYNVAIASSTGEDITVNTTATTLGGSKYIRAMYLDLNGQIYSEVDEVFFNVATNTYYQATGLLSPKDDTSGLTQIDCGTFDVGCQFQKALVFLFVPSPTILEKFTNLWQTIAEKKPFGYVTVTIRQLQNLNVSASPVFTLGTVPFMESLFTPFRTLVSGILWALFAIFFYQRKLTQLDI